jgi:hypothetical protein
MFENDSLPIVPKPHQVSPESLILDETITDVNQSTNKIIFAKYKKWLWLYFILSVAWLLGMGWYLFSTGKMNGDAAGTMILPFMIGFIIAVIIQNKVQHQFYQQFAQANSFSYQKSGWHDGAVGALFDVGNGKKMSDIIVGKFKNLEICLFNYTYGKGSGKSRTTFNKTVLELELNSPVPHMMLLVDFSFFGENLSGFLKHPNRIELPVELENQYNLYVEKEFEIEALQIFTPDVLAQFLDHYKQFSLDFESNKLYIYASKIITTKQELYTMYELAQYIIEKLAPVIGRLKTEVQTLEDLQQKNN